MTFKLDPAIYVEAVLRQGRKLWFWAIWCPFCQRAHRHSAGLLAGSPFQYLGAQVSHCASGASHRYILRAASGALVTYCSYRAREAAKLWAEMSRAEEREAAA